MNIKEIKIFHGLILLALILGTFLRINNLGSSMLGDSEAKYALQANEISSGALDAGNGQNIYQILTSVIFFVFGTSNFLARVLPALSGSLVVLLPYLFQEKIGKTTAVIIAYGLAFDPGLIAISRQAGPIIFSIISLLFGLGFLYKRKPVISGIVFSMFLLSGEYIWIGVISLGSAIIWTLITRQESNLFQKLLNIFSKQNWIIFTTTLLGSYGILGTQFLIKPIGISSFPTSLYEYLQSLGSSSPSILYLIVVFLIYETIPITFGLIWMIKGNRKINDTEVFIRRWCFSAMVVFLITPGRNFEYLIWIIIPLWVFTGEFINNWLSNIQVESKFILFAHGSITFTLLIFGIMNISALINPGVSGNEIDKLRLLSVGIAFALIILIGLLIGVGWNLKQSFGGIFSGVLLVSIIFFLSISWKSGGIGTYPGNELFRIDPYPEQMNLLVKTIQNVSRGQIRKENETGIQVVGIKSPSLEWALRYYKPLEIIPYLGPTTKSGLIITRSDSTLIPSGQYSGQDITGWQSPNKKSFSPVEWIRWIMFRKLQTEKDTIILWVRSDLLAGSQQPNTMNE